MALRSQADLSSFLLELVEEKEADNIIFPGGSVDPSQYSHDQLVGVVDLALHKAKTKRLYVRGQSEGVHAGEATVHLWGQPQQQKQQNSVQVNTAAPTNTAATNNYDVDVATVTAGAEMAQTFAQGSVDIMRYLKEALSDSVKNQRESGKALNEIITGSIKPWEILQAAYQQLSDCNRARARLTGELEEARRSNGQGMDPKLSRLFDLAQDFLGGDNTPQISADSASPAGFSWAFISPEDGKEQISKALALLGDGARVKAVQAIALYIQSIAPKLEDKT